jgi:V8-like Glu-specific endopeptidase
MTERPMRLMIWAMGLFATLMGPAAAQDAPLASLQTGDDAKGWEAVGRLDIEGKGFCTGALIAPDLVLTAAHCLYDRGSGDRIDPSRIEFQAGLRNGRALAYRDVRRAVIPAGYVFDGTMSDVASQADVALLELSRPIRLTQIAPFEITSRLAMGTQVGVVSYAQDRSEAPSLQEACSVLGQSRGVYVLSCDVNFGASGAPIFVFEGGVARIVSVVSAKAEMDGQQVALGTALGLPMAELRALLDIGGGGAFQAVTPHVRVMGETERAGTGAKFVRP